MSMHRLNRRAPGARSRSATSWLRIGAVGSALALGVAAPAGASDIGSFFGGVVGGILSQGVQQPQYAPQPQYYQQQPQYYQYQQQQPRSYQPRARTNTAESRRQAEQKRLKEQQ